MSESERSTSRSRRRNNRVASKISMQLPRGNGMPENDSQVVSYHVTSEYIRAPTGYGVRLDTSETQPRHVLPPKGIIFSEKTIV